MPPIWSWERFSRRTSRLLTIHLSQLFRDQGYDVIEETKLSEEELMRVIPEIHAIGVRSKTKLPERVRPGATLFFQ